MVKAYFRYVHQATLGLVTSNGSNLQLSHGGKMGLRYAKRGVEDILISGANENVLLINLKTGEIIGRLQEQEKYVEVTCLKLSPIDSINLLAAG